MDKALVDLDLNVIVAKALSVLKYLGFKVNMKIYHLLVG